MRSKNKKTKNNISKPVYDEDTVKESLIKLASETPEEEAEMLLDMELKQLFDEFIKNLLRLWFNCYSESKVLQLLYK